jgi:hypothetical protein
MESGSMGAHPARIDETKNNIIELKIKALKNFLLFLFIAFSPLFYMTGIIYNLIYHINIDFSIRRL